MKKLLSIILCALIIISIATVSFTANASGWLSYAQNAQLNSTFADEFSGSDYHYDDKRFDAFKFTVPAKGKVVFRIETENDNAVERSWYNVYNANNIDISIWEDTDAWNSNRTYYGYSSARGVYYYEWDIALSAGTYYLVASGYDTYMDITFDYSLSYIPTFSNTSITNQSAKAKAIRISWKKASAVTGYQIQYSLKKSMKFSKTVKINNKESTSKTIKNLQSKRKYYVRIRTCKKMTVEGKNKTYYGKWSSKKIVKTK